MVFDYLQAFPLPAEILPPKLQSLLTPVGLSAQQKVAVATFYENDPYGPESESIHMQMAVVPGGVGDPIGELDEASDGVVEYSIPTGDKFGCISEYIPSISGYDYIVASWGSGNFYTFNLAEKVWMSLGLTPRCVGNDEQRLVYDDLRLPEFAIAQGEVSSDFHFTLKRNVNWVMSNEYLRRYLWMRGARGVRVFYYSARMESTPQLRKLMAGQEYLIYKPQDGQSWYDVDIREHSGGYLLQVYASVEAISPELCPEMTAEGIKWPSIEEPLTKRLARDVIHQKIIHLDDKFLQKYEQNSFYDCSPNRRGKSWVCNPSYKGQWSFTECERVGRNLIRVSIRELYKPKPDREILHAHKFALDPDQVKHFNLQDEHIVSKVHRLVEALLKLGHGLSRLGEVVGYYKSPHDLVALNGSDIRVNGWLNYPNLIRLAQVAPLDMSEQMFLARCKGLHELYQRIPAGFLKMLLIKSGCPKEEVSSLASIKLLQSLLNVVWQLNSQEESIDSFVSLISHDEWNRQNESMAPLFLNNDLRIADAHESMGRCLETLRTLGFDTANINEGYGRALDFVMDRVIDSLMEVANQIEFLVKRTRV